MSNALQFIIFLAAGWVNRQQQDLIDYLKEENKVLREQLGGRRLHLTDDQRRRLALKGQALGRAILAQVAGIVTPDTILRWYQKLIARKYDGSSKRGPGRPRTEQELAALVVRIARENPTWGYTRLRGAMRHLGHELGRSTIRRLLKEHGITPAPERGSRMPWKTFLKAHWPALAAADFFNVEVLTISGLVRYWVLFVIALETRRVEIVGISPAPDAAWMQQLGRNLVDDEEGFLSGKRKVILDHDPLYTAAFRGLLRESGVKPIRLPPQSPNLNAYAERFVLSIKSECLNKLVLLGERHLRTAISEYVRHYHGERPHQGLENQMIEPEETASWRRGRVTRRQRLGGMLNYYCRDAA